MARLIPKGLITAQAAQEILEVSDTTLRDYVKEGMLKRHGLPGSKQQPYYRESEVRRLLKELRGEYTITTTFEQALEQDIKTIYDIDERTFPEEGAAASLGTCISWYRRNPHTFYVVRDEDREVVGYASFIPLTREAIDKFIRDQIGGEDLLEHIELYAPGKSAYLYCMSIAVDPDFRGSRRWHYYGMRLINGTKKFLLSLADQGVDLQTITARSYKEDGMRILRGLNIPQIRPPEDAKHKDKKIFELDLDKSGIPFADDYRQHLKDWREAQCKQLSTPPPVPTETC